MRFLLLCLLACPLAATAQTKDIDAAALERMKQKAQTTPAESLTKSIRRTPAQEEVTFDFTKSARVITLTDGTKVESPLVEIPLLFDQGQPTLRADAQSQANLQRLAGLILELEKDAARITVSGFASAEGDGAKNQKLSEDRAATVRAALIGLGIKETTLTAAGHGTKFAAAAATAPEPQRALDRKVVAVREL